VLYRKGPPTNLRSKILFGREHGGTWEARIEDRRSRKGKKKNAFVRGGCPTDLEKVLESYEEKQLIKRY